MGSAPLILVADGNQSCRSLITRLLRRIGFEAVEAKTGPETLEAVARLHPSLVVLDVGLPEVSGYEVCRELRDDYGSELGIIFVSRERTTPADRVAGLLVGADDYIVKPFDDDELLARARVILLRVSPRVGTTEDRENGAIGASLTMREREVLLLLARGQAQAQIAERLFISPKTVGGHIQRILTKLDVHSRAHAVALAHKHGLAEVEGHAIVTPLHAV
ncbi:MAG TPA: response regulator transcription factor [Vicinamibacterales bacterium]|jgi:DNA-binding NarL/FixJ family response regulator|nr:response regulator transcription factor [Vicinamibacterales bacterium]